MIVGLRNATCSQVDMGSIAANKLAPAWDKALLDDPLPARWPRAVVGQDRDLIRFGDGLPNEGSFGFWPERRTAVHQGCRSVVVLCALDRVLALASSGTHLQRP